MRTMTVAALAATLALCGSLIAASASAGGRFAARASSEPAQSAALVLIVNPSEKAESLEITHAKAIINAVTGPNLTVFGIYEQKGSEDPSPFNQSFLQMNPFTASSGKILTANEINAYCKKTQGTDQYTFDNCVTNTTDDQETAKKRDTQKHQVWQAQALAQINQISRNGTEQPPPHDKWNLKGALITAGQSLSVSPAGTKCVVLLGGLAVQPPPAGLQSDLQSSNLLSGATIVAADWRGTPTVQSEWKQVLSATDTHIVFLPQAVTDLYLVSRVQSCLGATP